jgi:hypothetical protein
MKISAVCRLAPLLLILTLLPGCKALNPLCGSARPRPVIASISPSSIAFVQVPPSFDLTVNGSKFVGVSVVIFNGVTLPTVVNSTSKLTVTLTSAMITAPGTYNVVVHTDGGNTGNLGCDSGGNSGTLVLTIT